MNRTGSAKSSSSSSSSSSPQPVPSTSSGVDTTASTDIGSTSSAPPLPPCTASSLFFRVLPLSSSSAPSAAPTATSTPSASAPMPPTYTHPPAAHSIHSRTTTTTTTTTTTSYGATHATSYSMGTVATSSWPYPSITSTSAPTRHSLRTIQDEAALTEEKGNHPHRRQCEMEKNANNIFDAYFSAFEDYKDRAHHKCYCSQCRPTPPSVVMRGNPQTKYVAPSGWYRFGLKVDAVFARMQSVFQDWHVAYHGTTIDKAKKICESGLQLLKPGDMTLDGQVLQTGDGHYQHAFVRPNPHSSLPAYPVPLPGLELFDPSQIFATPSIEYAAHELYAKRSNIVMEESTVMSVQCVFELRIAPKAYRVGPQTVGANATHAVDVNFANHELEWYTKQNHAVKISGLLIRCLPVAHSAQQ